MFITFFVWTFLIAFSAIDANWTEHRQQFRMVHSNRFNNSSLSNFVQRVLLVQHVDQTAGLHIRVTLTIYSKDKMLRWFSINSNKNVCVKCMSNRKMGLEVRQLVVISIYLYILKKAKGTKIEQIWNLQLSQHGKHNVSFNPRKSYWSR